MLCGCLRNVSAVAGAASRLGQRIGVVAAGERWPDGMLRPALEDWLGAGAIVDRLTADHVPSGFARAAAAAYRAAGAGLADDVRGCPSGRELIDRGYDVDVALACAEDADDVAPRLIDGAYVGARPD